MLYMQFKISLRSLCSFSPEKSEDVQAFVLSGAAGAIQCEADDKTGLNEWLITVQSCPLVRAFGVKCSFLLLILSGLIERTKKRGI